MTFKNDRIAVVTGASAEIGLATVYKLLEAGVSVVGCARRSDRLQTLKQAARERLLSTCQEAFGGAPDIFLVNAGKGLPGSILRSDQTKWSELFQVKCLSTLHQMRAAANPMLESADCHVGAPKAQDIVVLAPSWAAACRP